MQQDKTSVNLLIAFSKGFGCSGLFLRKIEKIISGLSFESVTTIQDTYSIAANFFVNSGVAVNEIKPIPRSSLKRNLDSYTHIVVFWDGEDLSDLVFFSKLQKRPIRIVPVEITKVRNKDRNEPFDVYIGRGTPWGNPYPIGKGGIGDTREDVIKKYKEYFETELLTDPEKRKSLLSLRGYRLACHCKPLACHGDVIAEYLNSLDEGAFHRKDATSGGTAALQNDDLTR